MRALRKSLFCLLLMCLAFTHVFAQGECADTVSAALEAVTENCPELGRNRACYGSFYVEAQPQDWVTEFQFADPADIVDIAEVQSLSLSSEVEEEGIWGVSLMSVQANLPDTQPAQNVTLLLFGQVDLTNAVDSSVTPVQLQVTATQGANIRATPTTAGAIRGSMAAGETLTADGRLADGTWVRVRLADGSGAGWVFAELLTSDDDLSTLNVVEPGAPSFGPMQAFYFQTTVGDAPCAEAPDSGILIQTPEGVGEISFLINEVDIRLGSTVYLQAQPGDELLVYTLEGQAEVTASDTTVTTPAGTMTRVPLDNGALADGAPTMPEPYDSAALAKLPIILLPESITIAEPLSEEEIQSASGLPRSGTWSLAVVSSTCEAEVEGDSTQITVASDGSTISFSDGTVVSRVSEGVYVYNLGGIQVTLQVVSATFMTFEIADSNSGCSLQAQMSFAG